MSPDALSRRTILFVNVAHALDHFVLLVYPTAVIATAPELGLTYASLIGLSTGTFVAFGLFSLPMGWLAERWGRRNLLAAFFGQSNRSFSQGDFNYDTVVNLMDFNILAGRFGAVLGPQQFGESSIIGGGNPDAAEAEWPLA